MSTSTVAIFLALFIALGLALWGIIAQERSAIVGIIAAVLALLAAGCAWYAWAESKSIPWTVGYGAVAAVCLGSAVRQFSGDRPSASPPE